MLSESIIKCMILTVFVVDVVKSDSKSNETTKELDNLLSFYDKRLRPSVGGEPVVVNASIDFNSIEVIDIPMKLEAHITLRLQWTDERLKVSSSVGPSEMTSEYFAEQIWTPDVCFSGKTSQTENDKIQYVRLSSEGVVVYSRELKVVSMCSRDLSKFPFDKQVCSMNLESYGLTTNDMELKWLHENSVSPSGDVGYEFALSSWTQNSFVLRFSTGEFSVLYVSFLVVRLFLANALQFYFPALLIVTISWLGFWIDPHQVTGRSLVVLLSTLALLLSFLNFQMSLKNINHVTMCHMFYLLCFFYIALAILEYIVVVWFDQRQAKHKKVREDKSGKSRWLEKLDLICRMMFPVTFFILLFVHIGHIQGSSDDH